VETGKERARLALDRDPLVHDARKGTRLTGGPHWAVSQWRGTGWLAKGGRGHGALAIGPREEGGLPAALRSRPGKIGDRPSARSRERESSSFFFSFSVFLFF